MKILVRNGQSKRWESADLVRSKAEADLQHLLIESPFLIPIDEIREGVSPLVFAVGEFGLPGSGNTDILALSADGDIAIIECKLVANPESRRKVIGQILEYASYLWGMNYREFDNRVQRLKGKRLTELIEEAVAGEWDRTSFEEGITQSLENGGFTLIIVVDEINEELRRIIRYINECSKSIFSLHALEVRRFQAAGIEILVPQLHGLSVKSAVPKGDKSRKWTREEIFEALAGNVEPGIVAIVESLYEWAEDTADRVWLGTGVETGSFTFHYIKEGKTISVFTVYTNGRLALNYGMLLLQVGKEVLEEFHRRITEIPTFRHVPAVFSKYPTIRVADGFKGSEELEKFKQAVEWLGNTVGSSVGRGASNQAG
nr:hypothetical protein [Chloroflexota bacterium]